MALAAGLLLALFAAGSRQASSAGETLCPCDRATRLEVRLEHDGELFVSATSETADPRLAVASAEGVERARDDDGGGGTASFLRTPAEAGEVLIVTVDCAGPGDGEVRLRWRASVENEATRTAAELAERALERAVQLDRSDGEAARAELAAATRALVSLEGAEHSAEVQDALYALCGPALELGAVEACDRAVESLLAFQAGHLPETHSRRIRILNLAAVLRSLEGDEAGARDVLERVLALLERTRAPGSRDLLTAETNLAIVRYFLGDVAGSRELAERAVATLERGGDARQLAMARGVLIGPLLRDGEVERAVELGELVVQAGEELGLSAIKLQSAYQMLGEALRRSGRLTRARELFERVLAEPPSELTRSFALEARWQLAAIDWELGHRERALEQLDSILREVADLPGEPGGWRVKLLTDRASWLAELDRRDELLATLSSLADETLARARALAAVQSPRELIEALGAPVPSGAVDRLVELDRSDERVFRVVESLRGLGLQTARRLRSAVETPALAAGLEEVRAAHAAVAAAWEEGAPIERAVRARDAAERALLRTGREGLAAGWELVVDAADLAPEEHAAIATFRRCSTREGARFIAFLLEPGGDLRRVDLGPAEDLDARIVAWRTAALGGRDAERTREEGRALFDLVLAPLGLSAELRRLVVVPDDSLHLVAFDALPEADGVLGDRVRVEVRVSLHELAWPAPETRQTSRLVAFGGVDYGERLDTAARSGRSFGALPGTAAELAAVAELYRAARARGGERDDEAEVELYTGAEADPAVLLEAAGRAGVLHLATHAFFELDGRDPESLEVLRATGEGPARLSPLSSAGLALAGINRGRDALGRPQGRVTAEELAGLDLSGCDLVVLSACHTGVGRVRAGQGVASLQLALRAAGARAVVASLWEVDDEATRELMRAFYTGLWTDGLPPREALWRAKQALRADRRPLRDWAGWVLTGGD